MWTAKFKKTKTRKIKKKVKVSQIGQSDSHRVIVPHQKKRKKKKDAEFHFILYLVIQ